MTSASSSHEYDDAMSSFFANDPPDEDHLYEGWKRSVIGQLRAQAILVDMEESVVDRLQRTPSIGFLEYGSQYQEQFLDRVSWCFESCSLP